IDNNIWLTSPDNTNTAETAHILSNRREKNLKLVIAILQERKLNRERFNAIRVHQKYNIPIRRQDKGLIARNILFNKRQGKLEYYENTKKGSKKGDVNNSDTEDKIPISHKQDAKKKPRKSIVVNSDTENDDKKNELTSRISELEYKEQVLALKVREIDLREREAKIYLMELSNFKKKHELEFVKS
ncbi:9628_t:CDS:2, partial [Funneliformis geosporum]